MEQGGIIIVVMPLGVSCLISLVLLNDPASKASRGSSWIFFFFFHNQGLDLGEGQRIGIYNQLCATFRTNSVPDWLVTSGHVL